MVKVYPMPSKVVFESGENPVRRIESSFLKVRSIILKKTWSHVTWAYSQLRVISSLKNVSAFYEIVLKLLLAINSSSWILKYLT
jgi:hypothetical protein